MHDLTKKSAAFAAALWLCICSCVTASADNSAPEADNAELTTCIDTPLSGTLTAADSDGDELEFQVVTPPIKGTVELEPDGSFIYTPKPGKRGRDYFGFQVTDSAGNKSQEATVIIKLCKPSND